MEHGSATRSENHSPKMCRFATQISLLLVIMITAVACTPMQSRIDPPYPFRGNEYSEAKIQIIAAEQCGFSQITPAPSEMNRFTTDGCSMWPDGKILECCIEHDIQYWCASTQISRKEADQALRDCAREHSGPANAFMVYWGSRMGAPSWLPFPWRWGYGYSWLATPSIQ